MLAEIKVSEVETRLKTFKIGTPLVGHGFESIKLDFKDFHDLMSLNDIQKIVWIERMYTRFTAS